MKNNQNEVSQKRESESRTDHPDSNAHSNENPDRKNPTNANNATLNKDDQTLDKGKNPVADSNNNNEDDSSARTYKSQVPEIDSTTKPPVTHKNEAVGERNNSFDPTKEETEGRFDQ